VLNETIAGCKDVVENMVDVLHGYNVDSLQSLIGNLSFHDFYTYDHSINVSMYCVLLYRFYKPSASRQEVVEAGLGGLLHDIGKTRVPTQVINKPGKLDPDEWEEIKRHPDYGHEMLLDTNIKMPDSIDCECVKRIVFEHHENYDGTGYPNRVPGEKIHLLARITAIADFFDAVTTKRSYSEPLSVSDALTLMEKSKNKKIDPKLFDLFASNTKEFVAHKKIRLELARDFDPCQPQNQRVLVSHGEIGRATAKPQDIGKVIIAEEKKTNTKNQKRSA
jgi:HD-GYP domain-containing protein (c-di-GMP phosphodiesterase class II)